MRSPVCPACGCSLVRLGITPDAGVAYEHDGTEYRFCCAACVAVFRGDPAKYLAEWSDLVVCPTCLAEKPLAMTVPVSVEEAEFRLCRCPHCHETFLADPQPFIKRLMGEVSYPGIFGTCCP